MSKKLDPYEKFLKSKPEPWEKEISDALERGEFVVSPDSDKIGAQLVEAARENLASKSVCVRMNPTVLAAVRSKAAKSGLPYQTLIKTLVYQFATGKITISL